MPGGRTIGRYRLHAELAAGGMATVHLGRLLGPVGFARTVAIKRLHPQFAKDPEFVSMFVDEARLAARIRHPNVVSTLDVVAEQGELFLVMDYVQGESLSRIQKTLAARGEKLPPAMAAAILVGALHGLHAAHEAHDEKGAPLQVVHRDVSPQNILVGADGIARVLDFGVAKAAGRLAQTRDGQIKGKIAYMAPEQFRPGEISRAVDLYAAGVVLWETLAHKRLVVGDSEAAMIERVLFGTFEPVREYAPELPAAIDEVLAKALARDPGDRFATARDMALAVDGALGAATMHALGAWLSDVAQDTLHARARTVAAIEASEAGETESVRPPATTPPAAREESKTVVESVLTSPLAGPRRAVDAGHELLSQRAGIGGAGSFARRLRYAPIVAVATLVTTGLLFLFTRGPAPTPASTASEPLAASTTAARGTTGDAGAGARPSASSAPLASTPPSAGPAPTIPAGKPASATGGPAIATTTKPVKATKPKSKPTSAPTATVTAPAALPADR